MSAEHWWVAGRSSVTADWLDAIQLGHAETCPSATHTARNQHSIGYIDLALLSTRPRTTRHSYVVSLPPRWPICRNAANPTMHCFYSRRDQSLINMYDILSIITAFRIRCRWNSYGSSCFIVVRLSKGSAVISCEHWAEQFSKAIEYLSLKLQCLSHCLCTKNIFWGLYCIHVCVWCIMCAIKQRIKIQLKIATAPESNSPAFSKFSSFDWHLILYTVSLARIQSAVDQYIYKYRVNMKSNPPRLLVNISAVHSNIWMKFHVTVKQ